VGGVTKLGLAPGASRSPGVYVRHDAALADADFVQENAPERPELKVKLFADIDDATRQAIIASSSSGITMSVMRPVPASERTVIGHPFNPPHVPLVEVVRGEGRRRSMTRWILRVDRKKPFCGEKLLATWPTASSRRCIESGLPDRSGVLDVADADDAVSWSQVALGVMGPSVASGGGQGGIQHFMEP
jgi:hypothetical protein